MPQCKYLDDHGWRSDCPVAQAGSPTAHPTSGSMAPPDGLITCVAKASGQITPQNSSIALIVEADGPTAPSSGPTARSMAPTTSPTPRAATMTQTSTSAPRAAPTTPPITSLTMHVLPLAAQPVPHVLQAGVVPVSPMVHPHLMRT
jgi:pyruvate/2-oxoglutarate dehydrogenase complex dihydrolipoamide acyltransferase (E2) component